MNTNRSIISDARRMMLVIGLLTAAFVGFLSLTESAEMQSDSPLNAEFAAQSPEINLVLSKLAYQPTVFTNAGGTTRINVINADGSGNTMLVGGIPLYNGEPAWSPDGAKIAYVVQFNNFEIRVMNADGSNNINLTNSPAQERNPSWSATGKIAYERDNQIWTMNADGTNQMQFSAISQPAPLAPSWSPDGAKMAFASGGEIYVINADGTNERRVTNNSTLDADPAWSPDGAKIIYGKGATGIAVVNLDGTSETNLTNGTNDGQPSWSSDGTKIAFIRKGTTTDGIYLMNANGAGQSLLIADIPNPRGQQNDNPAWQPTPRARPVLFDFDGDGKADVSVFRPSNGFWYRLNSQNNSFAAVQFGQAGDRLAPADYDGDGRTDIAVFREDAFAYFYVLNSADNTFRFEQFGTTGDVPVSGNWDNDGRADLAVYRNGQTAGAQSYFFYRPTATAGVDFRTFYFGAADDKPVVGDFDGDGKLDAAVFRPSNGVWYVLRSSDNQLQFAQFGIASDFPTAADFDGDGKTDYAVFRASNGTWYTSLNPATNYGAILFGQAGDVPAPADYDGDGQADAAVYRPSSGAWYLLRSTQGFTGVEFGAPDDRPIPNAFVP